MLPNKRNGPGAGRPESAEQDEALAGGRSIATLQRPADEFRDLARELISEMEVLADQPMICGCDTIDVVAGHDGCWASRVSDLTTDARHRLWLAELDRGRRG